MSEGQRFVDKCLSTDVMLDPWPHQIIADTLSTQTFNKLREQCVEKLNFPTDQLVHVFPNQYQNYGIDFYDETVISVTLY